MKTKKKPFTQRTSVIITLLVIGILINMLAGTLAYNKYLRIHTSYETQTQDIMYQTIRTDSAALSKGITQRQTPGEKGQRQITYKVQKKNGKEISRTITASVITKEPVDERISVGTYVAPQTVYVPTYTPSYSPPTTCNTQYHTYGGYFDPSATTTCY